LKALLSTARMNALSDSVLLVALTILAYNLIPPILINNELDPLEVESFYDNLYGMIASFFVVFVFWVLYTKILDNLKEPNDTVVFISLVFFIIVLLIPSFTLAQLQYENFNAVIYLSILLIVNDMILIVLWKYVNTKLLVAGSNQNRERTLLPMLLVIPSIYSISIVLTFFSINIAIIFPILMIPLLVIVRGIFKKNQVP
jgi:uncharacterized membrane protein